LIICGYVNFCNAKNTKNLKFFITKTDKKHINQCVKKERFFGMEIKLTQTQYDAFKNGTVTTSFEMLDVNDDNVITQADLTAATDDKIKKDIQELLKKTDEEAELKNFDLDEIDALVKTNAEKTNDATKAADNANDATKTADGAATGLKIDGVETVDVSNIKNETVAELQAKLTTIENNIKLIDAKLKTLQDEKKANEEELKKLNAEKEVKDAELAEAKKKAEDEQNLLDEYVIEYDSIQEEIETTNNKIRIQQGLEEARYEKHIEDITKEAIEEFNPEEHGDNFESFFLQKMNSEGYVMFSGLTSLNNLATTLSARAKGVMGDIIAQSGKVQSALSAVNVAQAAVDAVDKKIQDVQAKITQNTTDIDAANKLLETNKAQQTQITTEMNTRVKGGGLTGTELLAQISDAEKKLVIDNNIDLTTCFVALGADDKWHIYQANGTSVARQYGTQGGGLRGSDVVPSGSGYTNGLKVVEGDASGARAVYTFSSVNADLTEGEATFEPCKYSTSSPLAFDTNGDGVKTSTEKVSFDIDGDGQLDVVNNSADWVLAFDKDGDGKVGENGSELFGDNTDLDGDGVKDGYKDGFEALKALAKKEGLISDGDNALDADDLKKLEDKYGLKMTNGYGGEAKSLADLGITQINVSTTDKTTLKRNFDGQNNDLMTQEGATFVVNGETRDYADIWNRKYNEEPVANKDATDKVANASAKNAEPKKFGGLTFNLKNVEAIKGKVDYEKIKMDAFVNMDVPKEVLDKIIKLEEEEEA